MAEMTEHSDVVAKRWEQLRFVLGIAQMAGAVIAFAILLMTGVTIAGLFAVVSTSILTTVSVLLFGSHRRPQNPKHPDL